MLRCIEGDQKQDFPRSVGDFQLPSVPVDLVRLALRSQLLDRLERLVMGCFQIRNLDARLIQDPVVCVDAMKVSVHSNAALENSSTAGFKPFRSLLLDEQFPCNDAR